jgi:hypothetical protein
MKRLILVCMTVALLLCGCGYKLGSMTVGGISTISIQAIENRTGKSFIEESAVANTLVQRFNRDGTIKVVSPELADAFLSVILTDYIQAAQAFSPNDVGTHFRLILIADVEVRRTDSRELLSRKRIEGEATYEIGTDQTELERITVKQAITDLSIDIVRSILEGGW